MQGTSKGKQPMQPLPESPVQTNPKRKRAQEPFPKQQAHEIPKDKQIEQPIHANTKGKQPEQLRLQQPIHADPKDKLFEQPLQAKSKGKQPEQPRPQQSVQADPKGKRVEQPISASTKGKQSEQPRPQQPVRADPKGNGVEQVAQTNTKGKQPEQPRPQQPVQVDPKGKQVEQPVQANLKSKQSQQASSKQSTHPAPGSKEAQKLKLEQWLQLRPTLQPPPKKAILADAKPVYLGSPKVFIARIPGKKDAKRSIMHRVKVSVIADTAYRHPQTFFFKNLPDVELYWGFLNDAATTAQRVVRLERDNRPTPYFLLACRGEYPKVISPWNDNVIFADMHEPIFGDAFVFKLADPETTENGYARYAHIEADIGTIDWLPEAIREAAMKVEYAMAPDANPGFPDINNYADPETMLKDTQKMLKWMMAIKKATTRYGNGLPADAMPPLPDYERMKEILMEMATQIQAWKNEGVLYIGRGPESSDFKLVQDFTKKASAAFKAIQDSASDVDAARDLEGASSDSTISELSDVKTTDAVEKVNISFRATKDAFDEVKAIIKVNIVKHVVNASTIDATPEVIDIEELRQIVDAMSMDVGVWKAFRSLDPKIVDEFVKKVRASYDAMEDPSDEMMMSRAILELHDVFQVIKAESDKQGALTTENIAQEVDTLRKADATRTLNTSPVMPDLPGHPGTSRYRVERFD